VQEGPEIKGMAPGKMIYEGPPRKWVRRTCAGATRHVVGYALKDLLCRRLTSPLVILPVSRRTLKWFTRTY